MRRRVQRSGWFFIPHYYLNSSSKQIEKQSTGTPQSKKGSNMKPDKLINFRIPNDLKEAFDSVCQETKQTRTHQLINLMRDHVDQETKKLDQQNQSIHHQISRSKNRYQDKTGSNHRLFDDDWILVENNPDMDPDRPLEFYHSKGF